MKKLIVLILLITIIFLTATACEYDLMGVDSLTIDENLFEENQRCPADNLQDETEEWGMLHPFHKDGLWGFTDAHGEVIVEPQYLHVYSFFEGLAFVKGAEGREYLTGFIDSLGELVVPLPNIFSAGRFSEGFASIREWDGTREMLDPRDPVTEGHVIFIDRTGQDVFGQKFQSAGSFSEGLAFVRGLEGKEYMTGFIDTTGKLVIPLPDAIAGLPFSEGFAAIIERRWDWATENPRTLEGSPGPYIFIDRTGQNVFGQEFEIADRFSEGFAHVRLYRGNSFFIDHTGQNAFGMEFRSARDFSDGYAEVTLLDGVWRYIDRYGNLTRR